MWPFKVHIDRWGVKGCNSMTNHTPPFCQLFQNWKVNLEEEDIDTLKKELKVKLKWKVQKQNIKELNLWKWTQQQSFCDMFWLQEMAQLWAATACIKLFLQFKPLKDTNHERNRIHLLKLFFHLIYLRISLEAVEKSRFQSQLTEVSHFTNLSSSSSAFVCSQKIRLNTSGS